MPYGNHSPAVTSSHGVPPRQEETVITEIITTISQSEGVDPLELAPINEVVDASALNQFAESATQPATVRFQYEEWMVEVRIGDSVEITLLSDDE